MLAYFSLPEFSGGSINSLISYLKNDSVGLQYKGGDPRAGVILTNELGILQPDADISQTRRGNLYAKKQLTFKQDDLGNFRDYRPWDDNLVLYLSNFGRVGISNNG